MNIELPSTGCNILQSDNLIYNYLPDGRTRREYAIFDGQLKLRNESTSQYGYSYTGECLSTGDLIYKPEWKELIMPHLAIGVFIFIVIAIFKLLRGRA